MKILIINGPNINLIGTREPDIYGNKSFDSFFTELQADFSNLTLSHYQSNVEGEIINKLHETQGAYDGVILNAAGFTHTSVAIGDAVAGIETPVVEVHISNISSREAFRHSSFISPHAIGVIFGFGLQGYALAIKSFL